MIFIILYTLLPSIIFFGSRSYNRVLGQVRYPCRRCQQHSYHVVVLSNNWFTLYFVPVIPLGKSFSARCNLCGYQESPSETQIKIWFSEGQIATASPAGSQKTAQQWIEEGNAHSRARHYEQALAAYEQAVHLTPNFPGVYYQRGLALIPLRRYQEALASFDQAIRLAPHVPDAYYQKAITLDNLGRSAEAQAARERAQQLSRG